MTKQLLIYETPTPLSAEAHRDLSVRDAGFGFAAALNAVPLLTAEFGPAAAEAPIVFAGEGEATAPALILGLRAEENLFVAPDGTWTGAYVPAFLRRYPFVFAEQGEGGETLALCVDTAWPGVNREGRGERLFDADGNRTRYLNDMLQFASDYQVQHAVTRAFTARLTALDLLEPATANATLPDGTQVTLGGFRRVSADRLRALPDDTVIDLFRSEAMGLIYTHLASLGLMRALLDRLTARSGGREAA
jgi:hypothetical protein